MRGETTIMPTPNNKGKKYKTIDRDLVFRLASIQCTYREIAEAVGTSEPTIKKRFGDLIEAGRAQGRQSLRRTQWDKALKGDTKMLIWLGKNILKQRDQVENDEGNTPLPWEDK